VIRSARVDVVVTDALFLGGSMVSAVPRSARPAVIMLGVQYAKLLPSMRVNTIDPGYTATDLNGHSGPQTITEGTDAVVAMATIDADGPTGTFSDRSGVIAY
jgi:NAD(P)-dependent dehydrogenase (short-subunit alcohol dehydrogenase family)